ncbi:MAG TPA: hypothetical protein VGP79_12410 [Bryobacteraceae bacterium]|nr:hypothetical protein [Bryobacteraceae bacterium]
MRLASIVRFLVVLWLPTIAAAVPLRVLFIGNSLTVMNDLPALVAMFARDNGDRIETRTIAYPNYSLEDHWNGGDARSALAEGGWSFVVLQQGPSSLPESRVLLVDYAKRFATEAQRVKAKVALYMVWPASNRPRDFDGVKLSYETAARQVGGVFLPAGEAWRIAWRRDPSLPFYGSDGFHPAQLGSFLAALVIYQGLTGKSSARRVAASLSDAQSKIVREAAAEALGHGPNRRE